MVSMPEERSSESVILTFRSVCNNRGLKGSMIRIRDCATTPDENKSYFGFQMNITPNLIFYSFPAPCLFLYYIDQRERERYREI